MIILIATLRVVLWVVSALIVIVVLLQTGKGGSLAGVFGGGAGPESLLGTRAASFLVRVTVVLSILFLVLCLTLNRLGRGERASTKYDPSGAESAEDAAGDAESAGGEETTKTETEGEEAGTGKDGENAGTE